MLAIGTADEQMLGWTAPTIAVDEAERALARIGLHASVESVGAGFSYRQRVVGDDAVRLSWHSFGTPVDLRLDADRLTVLQTLRTLGGAVLHDEIGAIRAAGPRQGAVDVAVGAGTLLVVRIGSGAVLDVLLGDPTDPGAAAGVGAGWAGVGAVGAGAGVSDVRRAVVQLGGEAPLPAAAEVWRHALEFVAGTLVGPEAVADPVVRAAASRVLAAAAVRAFDVRVLPAPTGPTAVPDGPSDTDTVPPRPGGAHRPRSGDRVRPQGAVPTTVRPAVPVDWEA